MLGNILIVLPDLVPCHLYKMPGDITDATVCFLTSVYGVLWSHWLEKQHFKL